MLKSHSSLRKRLRRRARRIFGPKQVGLRPAFKDGWIFHNHVRVGKRGQKSEVFPNGKPKAIVVTKFRTMKKGAHADYEARARKAWHHLTWLGRKLRPTHLDELPQIISMLKGDLALVGLRPIPRQIYRMFPPKLKKIYDEVGPGLLGLQYACESKNPTIEEITQVAEQYYSMWKKNKARANMVFAKKILKGGRGKEIPFTALAGKK